MELSKILSLLVIFLLVCVSGYETEHLHFNKTAHVQDIEHAYKHRLLAEKTYKSANYSVMFIPTVRNAPLVVRVGVGLRKILEVEEFKQLVKLSIWVREYWNDYRLRWDPNEYDGINALRVAHGAVWTPDLMLYTNGGQDEEPLKHINVIVDHHGEVTYMYPALHSVACHMEIRFFPFDEQSCDIELGSWSYDAESMDLRLKKGVAAEYSDYDDNTGWRLISFTAKEQNKSFGSEGVTHYKTAVFRIVVRRYWTIHFFYMLIPILIIQLLSVMQFLLPCDSVEKVVLGVSIYLSMIIYLLMVSEILPSTKYIPHIVEYIVSTLCLVGTGEAITIVVLMIHHMGQHDNHFMLPQWARVFFLHWCAWLTGMSKYITYDKEHLARITKKKRDPLIENDSSTSSNEEMKEQTKEDRRASSMVATVGNVLRRLSRGGSLKKARNPPTASAQKGKNTPTEGRNTPSEGRNTPSEGRNTPTSGLQKGESRATSGSPNYYTPPTTIGGSETSGFSTTAGSQKDQNSSTDRSPKGHTTPLGGSQTSRNTGGRNTTAGGLKPQTKGRKTPIGGKKSQMGRQTPPGGRKTPPGGRKTPPGGRKTPPAGRNTPNSESQKGRNTPTTGSQKGQISPSLGSRQSSTKSASIQLHTSYLNLTPPESDANESNSNNVDDSKNNNNSDGPPNDPREQSNGNDPQTDNDNDPQAGNDNDPQAGNDNDPPAGNDNDPQAGNVNDPRAGNDNDPRAGNVNDPPAGNDNDPQAGNDNGLEQGDEKLIATPDGPSAEMQEFMEDTTERLCHVLSGKQECESGKTCEHCNTRCQPCYASIDPKLDSSVLRRSLERGEYAYRVCCCTCMKEAIAQKQWSGQLTLIADHADLKPSSLGTVSSSESKRSTAAPKTSGWLKVRARLLHSKPDEMSDLTLIANHADLKPSSLGTVSSSESKRSTAAPKASGWLKVRARLLHSKPDEMSDLTLTSSESKRSTVSPNLGSNWMKVKTHLLQANQDELSKSNEHLSARQRRLNEEMHKAQTGRLSFDYHKVDKKCTKEYMLLKIYKKLVEHKERLSDEDMEAEIRCEWQQVAMVLDRLMFFIYIIGTFAIILRMYNARPEYAEHNIVHLPNDVGQLHTMDDEHSHA